MNKCKLEILKSKVNTKFRKDNMISYIILILITLLICSPLIKDGFINAHDSTAHFSRNYGTITGLKNGEFLSAIVPNFCGGFGYSWNLFYPPLSTYINAIFYLITSNYIIAMKLTIILSVILSSIFMFKFIQNLTKNRNIALIVSILYITSIYFITDIYMRLAIGEIMTYMFLPLLFYGLYNIFYEKGKKNYLLTIGATGILLSHNISSLIVVIISMIFILIHWKKLFRNENSIQIWKHLIINAVFIILIVLFFYVPLLQHKLATEYIAMTKNGMSTRELVLNSTINLQQLALAQGITIIIPLLLTPVCYKKITPDKRLLYLSTLILGIVIAFTSTKWFLLSKVPDIFISIQFPWRMLLFSTFLLSIISGVNIYKCIQDNFKILFIVFLIAITYSVSYIFIIVKFNDNFDISYMYKTDKIENIYAFSQQCTNYDYLPVKARTPYIQNRENTVVILEGNAEIKNEIKSGNHMQFEIKSIEKSYLELPYIYYLGYDIKLNGQKIEYQESEHGFISIIIEENEQGIINVKYTGTKLSKMSASISIIGIAGFIMYVNIERKRVIT